MLASFSEQATLDYNGSEAYPIEAWIPTPQMLSDRQQRVSGGTDSVVYEARELALSTWTFGSTHKCYLRSCEFCHTHHSIHSRDDGPAFPEVYQEGLNQRYSTKASLKLMPNAQPILHPKHSLPLADLPRVGENLNGLMKVSG
ncbi:unnamed protein product [Hymenolepis diminuta]|uniref:C3H1-type domain-containing protein n=1 Tax=Hymenolepis diminuta TaxID=6216 RepID=A0A0R3SIX0_HYMDI|nr:unnamed protein product [Hymenolepis diminuta]